MSFNTFGHMLRVTTWGESHGKAVGCVIDGCPPGITFRKNDIQEYINRRRPGRNKYTSQRKELDVIKIMSGVLLKKENFITSGTPISILFDNQDQNSKDYQDNSQKYRPNHADYVYDVKYGIRDHRGGGRSSARETVSRVAAGFLAQKIIPDTKIRGAVVSIGPHKINRKFWNWEEVNQNPFFCPDYKSVKIFSDYLNYIRKNGSSVGAVIEIVAENVLPGLGSPIYGKLDQDLASYLMSINAVKGVEIGDGFLASQLTGEENVDEMRVDSKGFPVFLSNHSGGILGGISTGQPIVVRFAVKPTSSILRPKKSINKQYQEIDVITEGRHDPCVGIRAVPIGEAMVACVLADHFLRHRGQIGIKR